jgi:hypothetical protein
VGMPQLVVMAVPVESAPRARSPGNTGCPPLDDQAGAALPRRGRRRSDAAVAIAAQQPPSAPTQELQDGRKHAAWLTARRHPARDHERFPNIKENVTERYATCDSSESSTNVGTYL